VDPNKIEIDYDRVAVARIMDQIKEKTAAESANPPDASGTPPPGSRARNPGRPGRMSGFS
jgi:hypothetical protein